MKRVKKALQGVPLSKLTGNQVFIILVLALLVTAIVSICQKDSTIISTMWGLLW